MDMHDNKIEYTDLWEQAECYICQILHGTALCYSLNCKTTNLDVPDLNENGVFHLWRWSLSKNYRISDSLSGLLSPDEDRKAGEFKYSELKHRYIISHGGLRCVLGKYLSILPEEIAFDFGDMGKPRIAENQNDRDIRFSFSHSDNYATCAVTRNHDIGVDIEEEHCSISKEELTRLALHIMQPEESNAILRTEKEPEIKRFLKTWTIKEACCKATGLGLQAIKESWIHDYIEKGSINVGWAETAKKCLLFVNFTFEKKIFVSVAVDALFDSSALTMNVLKESRNGTLA